MLTAEYQPPLRRQSRRTESPEMTNNIVHDLNIELARVEKLLNAPIDFNIRQDVNNLLRFGRECMMMNDYRGMLEALTDLRAFSKPPATK